MTIPSPIGEAEGSALPSPAEVASAYVEVAQRASRLLGQFMRRKAREGVAFPSEEIAIAKAFMNLSARLLASPYRLAQAQMDVMRDHIDLWQQSLLKRMGIPARAVVTPAASDPRFRDEAWQENFLFDFLKQFYLITARHLHGLIANTEGLDAASRQRVQSLSQQYLDALSPSNFALTHPAALRQTLNSRGANLVNGLKNLLKDIESADLRLRASGLGSKIAATPGKVIFQNDLMQLIQYSPTTAGQYKRPLLIVPPWTNKYYIFDLRTNNSFVRWTTEQGLTTFIISWVNPDQELARKGFEDYLRDGTLAAIDAVVKATGEKRINLVAYCLGGSLLMTTLAYLAARQDTCAASATFLASTLDFADVSPLPDAAIADEEGKRCGGAGAAMVATPSLLNANALIWSFVVEHYLLGKDPVALDLLRWNADSTRLPTTLQQFYLENFQQANRLRQPGGISLADVGIDVTRVTIPCYFLSTLADQIAPWQSGYASAQLPSGPVRFVLGDSDHSSGIVDPPASNRHGYRSSDTLPERADEFLAIASRNRGSWWSDWLQWLLRQPEGQTLLPARTPGEGPLKVIEDAPGSYVRASPAAATA